MERVAGQDGADQFKEYGRGNDQGEDGGAVFGEASDGDECHAECHASLRHHGQADPAADRRFRPARSTPQPPAQPAASDPRPDIEAAHQAEVGEGIQLQGRARQHEEQDHEGPFDILDFVEGAVMMMCQIDDHHPHDHGGDNEGDLKPECQAAADEHGPQGFGQQRFAGLQSTAQMGHRQTEEDAQQDGAQDFSGAGRNCSGRRRGIGDRVGDGQEEAE